MRFALYSPDGSNILTGSDEGTIRFWDANADGQVAPALLRNRTVPEALLLADENRIATLSGGQIHVWDAETGGQIGPSLPHEGLTLTFGQGDTFYVEHEGSVQLWDFSTMSQVSPSIRPRVGRLRGMLPSGRSADRTLTWGRNLFRLWDHTSGSLIAQFRHSDTENDVETGALMFPDRSRILTWGEDGVSRLWDGLTGSELGAPMRHETRVLGARISVDQDRIATWSADGIVRIWRADNGAAAGVEMLHEHLVDAMFLGGERFITWGRREVRLWSLETGEHIAIPMERNDLFFEGVMPASDDRYILTWSRVPLQGREFELELGALRLWDTATGAQVGGAMRHDGVVGATFSSDARRILSWGQDGTARLWNARTNMQIGPSMRHTVPGFRGVIGARLSADEGRLLTWGDDGVRQWDVSWARSRPNVADLRREACSIMPASADISDLRVVRRGFRWPWESETRQIVRGLRRIDARDIQIAPILRHREGEDVCAGLD